MATVERRVTWDRQETNRRIRHPLQALSGHIRRYVVLEGLAVALIYVAACFWVWLLLDWGLFAGLSVDAVKWLDRNYPSGTAFFIRAFLLVLVAAGLVALVLFKVLRRLFTEFRDSALALVLERRFPKQLGDRLITAVELADPKLADKYGYSQEMIDFTIRAAAERVSQVPVREVFNWGRLMRQWLLVAGVTVGMYLVAFLAASTYYVLTDGSPAEFFPRFNRTASIWAKRDVALQHRIYWPTQSYVEFVRFQGAHTREDGTEVMKVAREDKRPDIGVKAFQWVIYDSTAEDSIRPLKFSDLKGWVSDASLNIDLPENWSGWVMSIDDLDSRVPTALIPDTWKDKTAGEIRAELEDSKGTTRGPLVSAGVYDKVKDWLNWRTWTVDRLQAQLAKPAVHKKLQDEHKDSLNKLEELIGPGGKIEELGESSWTNWNIRQLTVPAEIMVTYSGKQTRTRTPIKKITDTNNYSISLADLKENVNLTVQAKDFYTLPKEIILVPPPSFTSLQLEMDEPAYKYYWLQGEQNHVKALIKARDAKEKIAPDILAQARFHSSKQMAINTPFSQYDVLAGTNAKIVAQIERELKPGITVSRPGVKKFPDSKLPDTVPTQSQDGKSFWMEIPDIKEGETYEFELRFVDTDNVKGSRHIIIRGLKDQAPDETSPIKLAATLRTPASLTPTTNEEGEQVASPASNLKGYFITPDAILPFQGAVHDEYGLSLLEWDYRYSEVHFNLFALSPDLVKDPEREKKKLELEFRLQVLASGFNSLPLGATSPFGVAAQWGGASTIIERSVKDTAKGAKDKFTNGTWVMEGFQSKMSAIENKQGMLLADFANLMAQNKLSGTPPESILLKDYAIDTAERGFDVQQVLGAKLRPASSQDVQKHYQLQIWMNAWDNNVLSGPSVMKSKEPVTFLVISPVELRALILIQENKIRSELEKQRDKLEKEVRVTINDQLDKLKAKDEQDLALVRLRIEADVRKHLDKVAKVVNKAMTEYEMIFDEVSINRMDKNYRNRIGEKILDPLRAVANPKTGEVTLLIDAVSQAYEDLMKAEDDYPVGDNNKTLPKVPLAERKKHMDNLDKAQEKLGLLVKKLNSIIENIGGEIGKEQVIAELEAILESQKRQEQELQANYNEVWEKIQKEITGG